MKRLPPSLPPQIRVRIRVRVIACSFDWDDVVDAPDVAARALLNIDEPARAGKFERPSFCEVGGSLTVSEKLPEQ